MRVSGCLCGLSQDFRRTFSPSLCGGADGVGAVWVVSGKQYCEVPYILYPHLNLLSHDHPVSEGALGHSFRETWKMLGLEWNQYIGMLCCSLICISYKYEVIHENAICRSAITISDNNSKDHNDTFTLLSYLSIHTKSTYTNMYKFWYANDILMCTGKKHFSFQINKVVLFSHLALFYRRKISKIVE